MPPVHVAFLLKANAVGRRAISRLLNEAATNAGTTAAMLEGNADVDSRDNNGFTLLEAARCHPACVAVLLKANGAVDSRISDG